MAAQSRHPLARALKRAVPGAGGVVGVREHPGYGLEAEGPAGPMRLGRGRWVTGEDAGEGGAAGLELWFTEGTGGTWRLGFEDAPRADAAATLRTLEDAGYAVELLSGDRRATADALADQLSIAEVTADASPADKVARLEALRERGVSVLMVGDGLNDAPALAAAHASISPASAMDVSQTAADAVFQGDGLGAVVDTLATARAADRLVRQNLALAFVYNAVTVPIALAGLVTPLIAALAMSASSILVVSNALRLGWQRTALGR
jgi:Cu2+-exporting ATPase